MKKTSLVPGAGGEGWLPSAVFGSRAATLGSAGPLVLDQSLVVGYYEVSIILFVYLKEYI